jgi:hypothetical protein
MCTTRLARVAINVDDLRFGGDGLDYLVGGQRGRETRADVEELLDRALASQVSH